MTDNDDDLYESTIARAAKKLLYLSAWCRLHFGFF